VVLTAGASKGRFYTLELLDFYTEVFGNPGTATTGDQASRFVVMRCADDKSKLPAALQVLFHEHGSRSPVMLSFEAPLLQAIHQTDMTFTLLNQSQ
jgi:hypothetical protein